jgi:UDP-3-O-[3-hydroxymyristoyl] glucosamine N-acyltransferase
MLVKDLAATLGANWEGDGDRRLHGVASLEDAGHEDLSFLSNVRFISQAGTSHAACLLVPDAYPNPGSQTLIRVHDPRSAVAQAIGLLHPVKRTAPGVHPSAVVSSTSKLAPEVSIGPHCTIGDDVEIGEGSIIGAGSTIGDRVRVGARCLFHARVTVYHDVTIGNHVTLHSGSVIGADGFGFVLIAGAYEKFPQVGRVELGDRVEIGANSCVDRAALGVTSIGEGTKLDNMVHIGHNCRIGRHVVIAAQTGLSGGVVVGDYAIIGGQVGVGDKARIEAHAVIGSGAGILTSKIVRAGQPVWGTPARPLKEHLNQLAELSKLAKRKKRQG